jgi:hypothetical protein
MVKQDLLQNRGFFLSYLTTIRVVLNVSVPNPLNKIWSLLPSTVEH